MFGNIMEFTLPRFTVHSNNFNFDLQRFDLSDTQGDGSVFSCVKDGKTQYGTAEDFTTNNVGTATEIKLLKDFSISANVDVSSTCTFDLNGKTLTSTADNDTNGGDTAYALIVKSGNLTVKGTTAGSIVSSKARAIKVEKNATLEIENNVTVSGFTRGVVNFGTVNLKGGTITATDSESTSFAVLNNSTFIMDSGTITDTTTKGNGIKTQNVDGTFTMNGGTITATENGVAFNQDTKGGTFNGGDITAQRGVVNFSTQKVTINDANITATGLGVQLSAGSLEMNGGTITSKGTAAYVAGGATFTMNDGNIIADSSNVDTSNVEPDSKGEYSVWGAQGVEIASGSSESDRATFNMNGGSIVTKLPDNYHGDGKSAKTVEIADQGVVIWAYGVFKMSGGEIHTNNYFALTGNGSEEYRSYKEATDSKLQRYKLEGGIYSKDDNGAYVKNANYGGHTTIEISGGSITSENTLGIYHPQVDNSKLTISGGTITGTTGVEVRAGEINVTGGTITGTSTTYFTAHSNGNGSTSSGAGIVIAQHTTKKAITVNISGDAQVSGQVALSVTNPNNIGNAEDVKVNVTGGEFEGKQASLFYQDRRSELDVTGGDFKGAVVSTYSESNPNNKNNEVTINTAQGASDAAVTTTGVSDKVKIAGGTYSSDSNIRKYISTESANVAVQNADGTYGVANKGVGWSLVGGNQYQYLISTGGDSTASLLTASNVTTTVDNLISDSLYRVIGVADNNGITPSAFNTTTNDTLTAKFSWAKFTLTDNVMSISPQTEGVKIAGTAFVGNKTTVLTAASATSSIYVDATSNSLASIVGGDSTDYLKAGNRATTIDGGDGDDTLIGGTKNDSLKGGAGNDVFYYSAGADTIADFGGSDGTDADIVRLSGQEVITDGSKLTKVTDGFKLDFGSGNTLTFTGAKAPVSIGGGYVYTEDLIKQGNGVTLGADATAFDGATESLTAVTAIDGSAVTGALTITDNAQSNNITFGQGKNTFNYTAGNDTITGYDSSDVVSLVASSTLTLPTSLTM